jgi:hypothetical protein
MSSIASDSARASRSCAARVAQCRVSRTNDGSTVIVHDGDGHVRNWDHVVVGIAGCRRNVYCFAVPPLIQTVIDGGECHQLCCAPVGISKRQRDACWT